MENPNEPTPAASETPKRDYDDMVNGNGTIKSEEDEDEEADDDEDQNGDQINVSVPPPKKKQKRESSTESADEKFARQLQAEEEQMARVRTTRGGRDKKAAPKKKVTKKKSKAKVAADDDEDLSGDGTQKRKAGGGFQKPFHLSASLAEVCGEPTVGTPLADTLSLFRHMPLLPICLWLTFCMAEIALSTSGCQKALGAHQGKQSSGPERQATDPLRRKDAGRFQAEQPEYVCNEQAHRQPPLSCRRGIGRDRLDIPLLYPTCCRVIPRLLFTFSFSSFYTSFDGRCKG